MELVLSYGIHSGASAEDRICRQIVSKNCKVFVLLSLLFEYEFLEATFGR